MTRADRIRALRGLRRSLREHKDTLLKTIAEETRRSEREVFATEFIVSQSVVRWLRSSAAEIYIPKKLRSFLPFSFGRRKMVEHRLPLGNILIIGTWNYPLQIHFRQIALALFAGNTIYFKPSPNAEKSCKIIYDIFASVYELKERTVYLSSDPSSIDAVWEKIDGVVFTGSVAVGKLIAHKAAEKFIPAIIEASGNDSVVTGEELPKKLYMDHLLWALTTHSGETCIAPKILWYKRKNREALLSALHLSSQDPLNAREFKGYMTSNTKHAIESFIKEGCENYNLKLIERDKDQYVLLEAPDRESLKAHTLHCMMGKGVPFASVLTLIAYDSIDEVTEWTQSEYGGLMTTTLGLSKQERNQIERECGTSVVNHNEFLISAGIPSVSMGGSGWSGVGRSGGVEYMRQLTKTQTIVTPGFFSRIALPQWAIFNGKDKVGSRFLERMKRKA